MSVPESQAWREMVDSHPDVRCPYCADGQCDRCAAGVCECECRAGDDRTILKRSEVFVSPVESWSHQND